MSLNLPPNWQIEDFNLLLPPFQTHPEYFYHRLVTEAPVLPPKAGNIWIVSSYRGCAQILTDKRCIVPNRLQHRGAFPTVAAPPEGFERLARLGKHMLLSNPPDHTRLRALVSKRFTPKMLETLRLSIAAITHQLLDKAQPRGEMDLMADFACHLPALVIADLLGVPREDHDQFKVWSNDIAQGLGMDATMERCTANWEAQLAMGDYFDRFLETRRADLGDDLIAGLLRAEQAEERLTRDEVVSTCILLLFGGQETTTSLIGSGMLALLQNPDQLELFRRRPEVVRTAVEELLRYISPVQRIERIPQEPIEVGGHTIPAGQFVIALTAAANRDPAMFSDSERLDLTRDPNPHLGFGHGIHFCLGAVLARLEADIVFPILLERLSGLKVADPGPVWSPGMLLRQLKSLPVSFNGAPQG